MRSGLLSLQVNVYTFRVGGQCGDDANARVWNDNQATFSADMADWCVHYLCVLVLMHACVGAMFRRL